MEIVQERRIVTEIPGPRSRELLKRRRQAVPRGVFGTVPIFVGAAFGGIVRDVDGNSLIVLGAGLAVLNTGNSAPAVVEAAREQPERSEIALDRAGPDAATVPRDRGRAGPGRDGGGGAG